MPHGQADNRPVFFPHEPRSQTFERKETAMSKVMVGVLVAIAISVGASAQASRLPAQSRAASSSALLAQVKVSASEFKFVLSTKTAKRGLVTFKVTNVGKISHDFQISGRKTKMLSHGQTATLRVTFLRKGAYAYKCTVPGHAAAGMKGVFTIT
jgi:uncharacterized cupredoxin-like copper-binding protein